MTKILLSLIPLFIFCIVARSQTFITGKIIDAVSRQPLEAAYVQQRGNATTKTLTDQFGNFSIKINPDEPVLQISYVGYKTDTINVSASNNLHVKLQPDIINLKDIIIVQNNGQQKFSTLAKIDLDLKPVKNTQELLRIVPGLFVAQHAGGGKAEQIFLRGFDCDHGTDIAVSVDGIPVNIVSHAHGQGYADAHFIIP